MKRSHWFRIILPLIFLILVVGFRGFNALKNGPRVDKSASTEVESDVDRFPSSQMQNGLSQRPPRTQTSQASPATKKTARKFSDVPALLHAYATTSDWKIYFDENGQPFKMVGEGLPGLALNPETLRNFIYDLQATLDFKSPAQLNLIPTRPSRAVTTHFDQTYAVMNNKQLSVYQSWIRVFSRPKGGDVFMIVNHLKDIDPQINSQLSLSSEEAMAIAKAYLGADKNFELTMGPKPLIYASEKPHQIVLQVFAKRPPESRLLLIGNDSKSVIVDEDKTFF
jgi:hypothetical protein